nr:UDP-N-acetylmuramate:L-alanyl-gamma-D-glutamyl-meso-diaminopimelate [Candidatus Pantoea persica]
MEKSKLFQPSLGLTLLLGSTAARATASVDYRLRDRTYYDKLGLSTTLPQDMFIGVGTKFKTGGTDPKDKFYNDTVLNVVEVTFLKFYHRGNWALSPFIQPEFNSARTEWIFGFAPWYKINDSWYLGGLCRLELTDYAHEEKCDTGGIDYCYWRFFSLSSAWRIGSTSRARSILLISCSWRRPPLS